MLLLHEHTLLLTHRQTLLTLILSASSLSHTLTDKSMTQGVTCYQLLGDAGAKRLEQAKGFFYVGNIFVLNTESSAFRPASVTAERQPLASETVTSVALIGAGQRAGLHQG